MRKVTQLNHVVSDGGAEVRAMRIRLDHVLDGIHTPRQRLKEARHVVLLRQAKILRCEKQATETVQRLKGGS